MTHDEDNREYDVRLIAQQAAMQKLNDDWDALTKRLERLEAAIDILHRRSRGEDGRACE